jgi:hypothetical protein
MTLIWVWDYLCDVILVQMKELKRRKNDVCGGICR